MQHGQATSRFVEAKVHKPKQVDLGPRIMLDDERCILCSRCVRFTRDIAGDDALGFVNRGSYNTLAAFPGREFDNNYTLNTVDICPVGALTSKDFRFQMRVWFLRETKSLCTSCGTGCNVVVSSREEKVYRLEPRENDAVNSSWMCDAGRLNYKWIGREDRLTRLGGSRLKACTWTGGAREVAEGLRTARPGTVAIIASARQTNEELYWLKKIATRLGAESDSIPRVGEGDRLLVSADKNPNSNGARLTGICGPLLGMKLAGIADGIRSGSIRTLIVFGEDVTRHGISAEMLQRLDLLVVSDILPNQTTRLAHYLLPGCAPAEKMGSFVNVNGRLQKFLKALEPREDARPEIEFLMELLGLLGAPQPARSVEGSFNQMAKEIPALAGLTWSSLGDTGATVQI